MYDIEKYKTIFEEKFQEFKEIYNNIPKLSDELLEIEEMNLHEKIGEFCYQYQKILNHFIPYDKLTESDCLEGKPFEYVSEKLWSNSKQLFSYNDTCLHGYNTYCFFQNNQDSEVERFIKIKDKNFKIKTNIIKKSYSISKWSDDNGWLFITEKNKKFAKEDSQLLKYALQLAVKFV
jgi:hypothetical protein